MERHKIITASYLLLEKDSKLLMLRRFNTGYRDGDYSLIAGHGEERESPRQCIVREAWEEAGIKVFPEDLILTHVNSRIGEDNEERLNLFWQCSKWEGEIMNKEPHKCDDLSWFQKDDLPENLVPELKVVLSAIKAGEFYSEFNWN